MATNEKLNLDKDRKPISEKVYNGIIGSMLYLTTSYPDIIFNVYLWVRFQASPKECHLGLLKEYLDASTALKILVYDTHEGHISL